MQTETQPSKAGERTQSSELDSATIQPMTADEIQSAFGIVVDSERLSDGSRVWNVLLSAAEINCLSEKHARQLAFDIAVAIRNNTAL